MSGNPFDPLGGGAAPASDPWSSPSSNANNNATAMPYSSETSLAGTSGYGSVATSSGPFGAAQPPQQQQPQAAPYYTNNPANSTYGGGAPAPQASTMIVAPQQSNPYAMAAQHQHQQMVVAPQQGNPYAMPPQQQQQQQLQQQQPPQQAHGFDPFFSAPAPPPAPAPAPPQEYAQAHAPAPPVSVNPYSQAQNPPGDPASGIPQDPPSNGDGNGISHREAPDTTASPAGTTYPPQVDFGHRPDASPDADRIHHNNPASATTPRNKYAGELARQAPPGASPLPKADLVRKKGYVLGRISFRTIVMKKWKQTYWVQYGPHTMLWFRSLADFDDWLNNPYLMQNERNFLIKLAVNFVHDLYKPNVRGYQVTQCRTKGYGNKMVRQFKLERWMDYGPTIAAAFGSYNPAEVDALREAVVECMRNTPLSGGIRATGAVRQPQNGQGTAPNNPGNGGNDGVGHSNGGGAAPSAQFAERPGDGNGPPNNTNEYRTSTSYDDLPGTANDRMGDSVAEEADLLDVNNWDDVPTEPQQGPVPPQQQYQQQQYQQPPGPHGFAQPSSEMVVHAAPAAATPWAQPPASGYPPQPQMYAPQPPSANAYPQPPSTMPPPQQQNPYAPQANNTAYPPQQQQNPWGQPPQQQQQY